MPFWKKEDTIRPTVARLCTPWHGSERPPGSTAAERVYRHMPPMAARERKYLRSVRNEAAKMLESERLNRTEREMVTKRMNEALAREAELIAQFPSPVKSEV